MAQAPSHAKDAAEVEATMLLRQLKKIREKRNLRILE